MKFKFNKRVLEQLGTELITTDEVAVTELIKNAYDAHAKEVRIHFLTNSNPHSLEPILIPVCDPILSEIKTCHPKRPLIIVEDDGDGMNEEIIEEGFFTVGSDIKNKQKINISATGGHERAILGEKGLGRLSAQRLSKVLFLETTAYGENKVFFAKIDWEKLISDKGDDDVELIYYPISQESSYTRLWLCGSKINFDDHTNYNEVSDLTKSNNGEEEKDLTLKEELQSAVSFLASPFEDSIEEFDISFWQDGYKIKTEFNKNTLNVAESVHSFKVIPKNNDFEVDLSLELRPWYLERLHHTLLGKELYQDMKRDHSFYAKLLKKYKLRYQSNLNKIITGKEIKKELKSLPLQFNQSILDFSPINGAIYAFKRETYYAEMARESALENGFISKSISTKIKKFLEYHNGIKLYRNKFRIATLGNKDSDWLKLAQARTRGQQFFRFELGNTVGYVNINDVKQKYIKEITSRLDIVDNFHKYALNSMLEAVINTEFYNLSSKAYYISIDILNEEKLLPEKIGEKLKKEFNRSKEIVKQFQGNLKKFQENFQTVQNNISLDSEEKIRLMQKSVTALGKALNVFYESSNMAIESIEKSQLMLKTIEQKERKVEIEFYNNFKLMANGLITETLTHELHSLIPREEGKPKYKDHIKFLGDYLINHQQEKLYDDHLYPLDKEIGAYYFRMSELNQFYFLMEKTFLYKGTMDDFEIENLHDFLNTLTNRLFNRLDKNKITIDYANTSINWEVPKGSLIHVFYNLIDNSIYWINERRKKQRYDNTFFSNTKDCITIKKIDCNMVHYYDTGTGVLDSIKDQIFHPLISGKEKEGRGMGMYIVKKLLESFDAKIELLPETNQYGNRYIFAISLGDAANRKEDNNE